MHLCQWAWGSGSPPAKPASWAVAAAAGPPCRTRSCPSPPPSFSSRCPGRHPPPASCRSRPRASSPRSTPSGAAGGSGEHPTRPRRRAELPFVMGNRMLETRFGLFSFSPPPPPPPCSRRPSRSWLELFRMKTKARGFFLLFTFDVCSAAATAAPLPNPRGDSKGVSSDAPHRGSTSVRSQTKRDTENVDLPKISLKI